MDVSDDGMVSVADADVIEGVGSVVVAGVSVGVGSAVVVGTGGAVVLAAAVGGTTTDSEGVSVATSGPVTA